MEKHVIFYFSGTGNCLLTSRRIAKSFGEYTLISMGDKSNCKIVEDYDSIGFVVPTYYLGLPRVVESFLKDLQIKGNKNTYFYAIQTYSTYHGVVLPQIKKYLKDKGFTLNYGARLLTNNSNIFEYKMKDKNTAIKINDKAKRNFKPILQSILNLENKKVGGVSPLLLSYHNFRTSFFNNRDKNYIVSDECEGCGDCEKACPVGNIVLKNNKPTFKHKCECCTACIQVCRYEGINYKHKTNKRGRFINPDIKTQDIIDSNS